ncbi:cytochrome-c peroxidase [Cytophagaceae bacterium ABcell3]|nr:cytochrome-c peroxidase [Cytophagaceae bacterium ABcell3]
MKKTALSLMLLTFLIAGCGDSEEKIAQQEALKKQQEAEKLEAEIGEQARNFFKPLPKVAESPDNKLTEEKVHLGKVLYFDKRLSKNNDISCNSCHDLTTFGVDNLSVSPGHKGQTGDRNSPTVLNAAFHTSQFWDGRAETIEEQAGMPILNPVEMAIPDEAYLENKLSKIELYQNLFAKAFPDEEQPLTYRNIENAIGAFERTLVTPSRFDEYLEGDVEALTFEEKQGLKVYMESGCTSCHSGALLGGNMLQKFGLFGDYWTLTNSKNIDKGRYLVTNNEADKFMFKVPSLRNCEKTAPYFHDGSVESLGDAIKIMAQLNLNKELSDDDVAKIELFIATLTSELPEEVTQEPIELKE